MLQFCNIRNTSAGEVNRVVIDREEEKCANRYDGLKRCNCWAMPRRYALSRKGAAVDAMHTIYQA